MTSLKMRAARLLRTVAATTPATAEMYKKMANKPKVIRRENHTEYKGSNYSVIKAHQNPDARRLGFYLRGACDLPAVVAMIPMMAREMEGTIGVWRDPIHISGCHSELMLQTIEGIADVPPAALDEVTEQLQLHERYFSPDPFDKQFSLRGDGEEVFDKSVIFLSTAPDFSRNLYRHREHGFLVDPGGFWLNQSVDSALQDMGAVDWFSKTFKGIGRSTPDAFTERFGHLVDELKARTGAHVLVFGMLTVDPSDKTHSYRLVKRADNVRRREFVIRLKEMSAKHDFDVVDVGRILKLGGIDQQVDFAHFNRNQFMPIAAETFRILKAREIL